VFQLETNEEVRGTGQKQMTMQSTDKLEKVLKSLSPLISSMKPFGLYFTRQLTNSLTYKQKSSIYTRYLLIDVHVLAINE